MFIIWGAMHGCALVIQRFWKKLRRPLPPALAWLVTFAFVNCAWVFFRAKTLDDALRVLRGMMDFRSAFGQDPAAIPASDLAWAGWFADILLKWTPASLVGQVPAFLAIIAAFVLIARKNSMEMASGVIGRGRLLYGAALFAVALYFTLAATSSVFLYFNF